MREIKNILLVYLMLMIALLVSASGVYIINKEVSIYYTSSILTITPIIAVFTIFIEYIRVKKIDIFAPLKIIFKKIRTKVRKKTIKKAEK